MRVLQSVWGDEEAMSPHVMRTQSIELVFVASVAVRMGKLTILG